MFADDATVFIPNDNLSVTEFNDVINDTLKTVILWLESINLKVNLNKTKLLQFRNYRRLSTDMEIKYINTKIDEVDKINFLGVTLDTHLNWKAHVETLNKKISSYCYALSILVNVTSEDVARNAYYGYVYSLLNYGVIFWGNSVNVHTTFLLQKRCVRTLFRLHRTDSLRTVFPDKNLLTLTGIYILQISLFVKKHKDYFIQTKSTKANIRPQYEYDVCIPNYTRLQCSMMKKSTFVMGVKIFNHLPRSIKMLNDHVFSTALKNWLITRTFYNVNEFFATDYH